MGPKVELTGKRGLLIVDDDDAVRSFVCVASRKLGYQVMEAVLPRAIYPLAVAVLAAKPLLPIQLHLLKLSPSTITTPTITTTTYMYIYS